MKLQLPSLCPVLSLLALLLTPALAGAEVAAVVDGPPASVQTTTDVAAIRPFREIGASLGERALHHNNFAFSGAVIFDANGDGRLDLYLPHSGRPVPMATSEEKVLTRERVPALPNTLFLNQGNDASGAPVLVSVQDLAATGDRAHLRAELLIEDKYEPRDSLDDDEGAPGRIGSGAIAADFNGDGRLDLYVLNALHGSPHQTPEMAMRVYPARDNEGRDARETRQYLAVTIPPFMHGPRLDGLHETVRIGERVEAEGRNSLYINLGDRDGDGVPEWRDATEEAGVGGRWSSASATVADVDRDGDLDLYVANFLDPDFWGFGMMTFAGHRNQLYLNQLAETGRLAFRESALELGVAGLHEEEQLPSGAWYEREGRAMPMSRQVVEGRLVGEPADHSWAAQFLDWNQDGWSDLVVANDVSNRLRVYLNEEGRSFRRLTEFDEPVWDGCWMGIGSGDLDGDLREEILVTNCGSQTLSVRNSALLIEDESEANIVALSVLNATKGKGAMHHALLRPGADGTLEDVATALSIRHSAVLPPDIMTAGNIAPEYERFATEELRVGESLTGLEFAWSPVFFDVDSDGDLDLYLAGALGRGNDNFLGDWSGGPGRLLVNDGASGGLSFADLTLEYRLLDIAHLDYDAEPVTRKAPGTGWHKRDRIYLDDTDAYGEVGLTAARSSTRDLFRMHEAANGLVSGDLNGDGFADLVVTHAGGYNSVSPSAGNLKAVFEGRTMAIPAPNQLLKPPTAFEPGRTSVYINGGPPAGTDGHWVKLRLLDPESSNRFGVGARVKLNGDLVRSVTLGGNTWSAYSGDLLVGLGKRSLTTLDIHWPSGSREPERLELSAPLKNQVVCVQRGVGVVDCPVSNGRPQAPQLAAATATEATR